MTHHTSGNLFFPSISSDGRTIVYEENFGIWKLDTASGKSMPIRLSIASDEKENNLETLVVQNEAESFHLSPSTRRAAISTHGELFTIATDRGEVRRVTESYARESDPRWSPDGKALAFLSDRTGREEVWIADEYGKNLKKLSDSETQKSGLQWAPDSKSLLYAASDHKLYRVEIAGGKTDTVAYSEVMNISNAQFSPDGKWISYTKMDRNFRPHVHIVQAEGGQERMLDREDLFSTTGARWTPDGKKLIFLAGMMQGGSATVRQTVLQLYSVALEKEDKNPVDRGVDDEQQAQAAEQTARPRPGGTPGAAEAKKIEVRVDWDGMSRRIRRLTRLGDSIAVAVPSPDSRTYAFVTMGEQEGRFVSALYTIQADGERMTRLTQSQQSESDESPRSRFGFGGGISSPQFSKEGRTLFFQEGNGIYSVEIGGGLGTGTPAPSSRFGGAPERKRINFAARVAVDHAAEWKQVFNESWRVMKHQFYDPKMHGVDWAGVKKTYEPLLDYVGDQEEMHNVVSQMIGELNASHTGISASGSDRGAVQTRHPGFEIEPDPSGYYKVTHVYKHGPADGEYVKIHAGDFILALNDKTFKVPDNYWQLYNAAPGRSFEFTVNSKPAPEGAWKSKVEPVTSMAYGALQYEKWVAEHKAMVEKLSGGEIGYLHIRQMDTGSLRKFERDLIENHHKKALIIDQRFNPGGGIDQELLQILGQRQYQYTRFRDSIQMARPQRGFFGPMVVMQNERSTSDAEVFPDGFRTLGLGKVVGVTTYGAVIGTGSHRMMDGSSLRTPGTGLWSVKGHNLENYGVPPDVYVDNAPEDFLQGRDAQIEKAVEVLRQQLRQKVR